MAKIVNVAPQGSSTYNRLPGNTAELTIEGNTLDDTVFGQSFSSMQPAELQWQLTANGLYKGFAGYQAKILKTDTGTSETDEAVDETDAPVYQVVDTSKRLWDIDEDVTINDDGSPIDDSDIEWIDYLTGSFKLVDGYTPSGTITADFTYLGTGQLGTMNTFTLSQTAEEIDRSDLETLQGNEGYRGYELGLKSVSLELSGFHDASEELKAEVESRSTVIIEIGPKGDGSSVARGFFKPVSRGQSGDVGQLEEETITYQLFVPANDKLLVPFKWIHDDETELDQSIRDVIEAWEDDSENEVQYLYDGESGHEGTAIPTDLSLSGGLESMNEFSFTFRGTGALTEVTP